MKTSSFIFCLFLVIAMVGCSKNKTGEVDTEYPGIDLNGADAFPRQCSEVVRGQSFVFRAHFTDNHELGSYSVDIHHNFDHHTHSTEVEECALGAIKTPEKPFLLIRSYSIPEGLKTYSAHVELQVPANVDPGDYHFLIRLTDREGWQTIKGLSIKIK